jgi:hypothetical protein
MNGNQRKDATLVKSKRPGFHSFSSVTLVWQKDKREFSAAI